MGFIDPKLWFGEVAMLLGSNGTNINTIFLRIGVLIYFVSFAIGAVSWILNRRSIDIITYLVRTLVAGALLANLSPLNVAVMSMWENAYDGAVAIQGTTMQTQLRTIGDQLYSFSSDLVGSEAAISTLTNAYSDMSGLLPSLEGDTDGVVVAGAAVYGATEAGRLISKTPLLSGALRTLNGRLTQFVLPVLSAFSLFTFLTGLTILVGLTLLPLILGLFPTGLGTPFLVRWVSIILTALATVIFIPLLSNMLLNFTIVQPVTQLSTAMSSATAELDSAISGLPNLQNVTTDEFKQERERWYEKVWNSIRSVIPGVVKRVNATIDGAFNAAGALLVGLVLSVVAIFRLESIISSFLQSAGAGAATAALAIGAMLRGGGGGGGDSKGDTKRDSDSARPSTTVTAPGASPSIPRGPSPTTPAPPRAPALPAPTPASLPPPSTRFLP